MTAIIEGDKQDMQHSPRLGTVSLFALVLSVTSPMAVAGGDPEAGKEKSQVCVQCHGETGHSVAPSFPILAGQYRDYLILALEEYKSGKRTNAVMAGFAATLSDEDREDIAAFYSKQKGLESIEYAE